VPALPRAHLQGEHLWAARFTEEDVTLGDLPLTLLGFCESEAFRM